MSSFVRFGYPYTMEKEVTAVRIGVASVLIIFIIIGLAFLSGGGTEQQPSGGGLKVIGGPDILIIPKVNQTNSYTEAVKQFLDNYQDGASNTIDCSRKNRPQAGQVCNFQKDWVASCRDELACIYLTLTLKANFTPEAFTDLNDTETRNLPQQLEDRMKKDFYDNEQVLPERLWLNCESETLDEIHYAHWPGYPLYYFDKTAAEGYIMPFVLVSFKRAQAKVDCAIYARNIDAADPYYKTSFHVKIEN